MQITDIKVRKVSQEGKMKAVVSVTFDDVFVVHDIKVIEGKENSSQQCPAESQQTAHTETLYIPLHPTCAKNFRMQFLQSMKSSSIPNQN